MREVKSRVLFFKQVHTTCDSNSESSCLGLLDITGVHYHALLGRFFVLFRTWVWAENKK